MIPTKDQQALIDRLDQSGLSSALIRDFSMILPYIFNEDWHTSISLRKRMRPDSNFTRKELSKLSQALYSLYHNTKLLQRREKRKLYFHHYHHKHISHWAYTLNWEYLSTIMPNPEEAEMHRLEAQINFNRSIE